MTLRMADSTTVALLPSTFDAYAGYVDGNFTTWLAVVARFGATGKPLLSITVKRGLATCLDVENGDATISQAPAWWRFIVSTKPRPCIYTSVANVNALVGAMTSSGIPRVAYRLWTAHYTAAPHICSPVCWPGLVTTADGTQWTNTIYGKKVDQSMLADTFFDTTLPNLKGARVMGICVGPTGAVLVTGVTADGHKHVYKGPAPTAGAGGPQVVVQGRWTDMDLSDQLTSEEGSLPTFIA